MRVALLSDMHGNAVAFRAALADIERQNVDLIVSLGDVAQGGPQPTECVELLSELQCPRVFGNSDAFLVTLDLGAEPVEDEQERQRLLRVGQWSREQLRDEGVEFLRSFRPTLDVDVGGRTVLCCHATPNSNEEIILPSTPLERAAAALNGVTADGVAAGHVHLQWLRRFGGVLWFCVGSVGLVYQHTEPPDAVPFEPWAEYAILGDELAVEFRRVPFDVEELIAIARAKDFPDFERWAPLWKR
jgi:predicted phosphodiesterase